MELNEPPGITADPSAWTETERRLAIIWRDVLEMPDSVARDGSFIELGGDSIAATLCVRRIDETFRVELPLDALLQKDATVNSVAGAIDTALATVRSGEELGCNPAKGDDSAGT